MRCPHVGGLVRIVFCAVFLGVVGLPILVLGLPTADLPHIKMENGVGRLIVNGRPFLFMGGELDNSSAGTAAQADSIVPKLAALHLNTILVPVAWEQIEPKEGSFDFSILDHWMETARHCNMRLVLLWFGSWKNAFSNYAPSWVKSDPKRFPRAYSADGRPLEILSTLSAESRRCDSRAFAALLNHLREKDSQQQTVLMVQVENEVGYLGRGRDRSREANLLLYFSDGYQRHWSVLSQQSAFSSRRNWQHTSTNMVKGGVRCLEMPRTKYLWRGTMAAYIEAVARAGKSEYALPM